MFGTIMLIWSWTLLFVSLAMIILCIYLILTVRKMKKGRRWCTAVVRQIVKKRAMLRIEWEHEMVTCKLSWNQRYLGNTVKVLWGEGDDEVISDQEARENWEYLVFSILQHIWAIALLSIIL